MVNIATILPIPDRYIKFHPHDSKFRCDVCGGRPMKDYTAHIRGGGHISAINDLINQQLANQEVLPGVQSTQDVQLSPIIQPTLHPEAPLSPSPPESPIDPPSPLTFLRNFLQHSEGEDSDSDAPEAPMDFNSLKQALDALADEESIDDKLEQADEAELEEGHASTSAEELNAWYPFERKEQVVALLIIGSNRSIISRSQYQTIRLVLRILAVNLPEWGTLRTLTSRLKSQLGINITERLSPSGTPLFGLDVKNILKNELANPMVSPHLVFVPELPSSEDKINRLSQSMKWREGYSLAVRVQMVVSAKKKHVYIYEPVQLETHQLVVPVYFYQYKGKTMAKCLPAELQPHYGNPNRCHILLPEERGFNSDELYTVDVNDIWKFFHEITVGETLLSDICHNMYQLNGYDIHSIPLVNPWREKADGRVIRHVPITLYSDDTSGNVSKKFNQHMSIYFTLSGLAPEWTNQEFNIHFLATSNSASALELLDEIVDNINDIGTNGFSAYDHSLGEEVLVMAVVLCHVGDLPMHAEICNTTNPAITLTPCRICDLKVPRQAEKKDNRYVRDFLGRDDAGHKTILPARQWDVTQTRTHEIWKLTQKSNSSSQIAAKCQEYGQKDTINDYFIKKMHTAHQDLEPKDVDQLFKKLNDDHGLHLFNPMLRLQGFDGHQDTPVETLHVVLLGVAKYLFRHTMHDLSLKYGSKKFKDIYARWKCFKIKGLNVPPIIPTTLIQFNRSLVGKEFRTVLQSVPFVLFDHISKEQRHLWTSLCLLSSYIFQSEITDLKVYLSELDTLIDRFLQQLVHISARWVNQPKFHMLVHLKECIRRFGPAILYASEKFESFNFSLRNASVHSNRQSPGKDIANHFNNRVLLRILLSGSSFFDHEMNARVKGGHWLINLLQEIPHLHATMGLRRGVEEDKLYTSGKPKDHDGPYPDCLGDITPQDLQELPSITIPNGQKIEPGDFVLLNTGDNILQVCSIWKPTGRPPCQSVLVLNSCTCGRIVPFYSMREFIVTDQTFQARVKAVQCLMNVQHNCHDGNCTVGKSNGRKIERRDVGGSIPIINHDDSKSYVLNSAAHYSAELHRRLSQVEVCNVTAAEWNEAIERGIENWNEEPVIPRKPRAKKSKGTKRPRHQSPKDQADESDSDI